MANKEFRFTVELLREYSAASLTNAAELVEEASLLYEQGHVARAYFLSVASIEEIGKALLAFDGQGRNLADSAVTGKLRRAMEDHSQKIAAAFIPVLLCSQDIREVLMPAIDLMIHLTRGREPSMYVDIVYGKHKVQLPRCVVRDTAAEDCIRLARNCLSNAQKHISEEKPRTPTRVEDQLFALKSEHLRKMVNREDFWWHYIAQCQAGNRDFAAAAIAYQREYFAKGKAFEGANKNRSDTQSFHPGEKR
jgi:AbiV family abortive infection protein